MFSTAQATCVAYGISAVCSQHKSKNRDAERLLGGDRLVIFPAFPVFMLS